MSSIIQLVSVRCYRHLPLRGARCYKGLNPSLHLSVGSRGYCFMPKSMDEVEQNKRIPMPFNLKVPDDFKLIYRFTPPFFIPATSYFAAFLTLGTVWATYVYMTGENNATTSDGEPPTPIAETESPLEEEKSFSWKDLYQFDWNFKKDIPHSEKAIVILLVPIFIATLLHTRSGLVLHCYRRGSDYIIFLARHFGFGYKVMEHGLHDIKYYPNRKLYKHEVKGTKVVIFPEFFVSENEYRDFCSGTNLKESNSK